MLRRTLTLVALASAVFPATAAADRAWMRTGPLNAPRTYPVAATLADGRALLAGGNTDTAEIFDPAADRWTPVAPMAHRRWRAAAVTLRGGRVLVAGGDDYARTAEVYDARANTWTPTGAMTGYHEGGDAVLLADGRVLMVGGSSS